MNSLSEIRRWLEETYGLNLEVIGADALERNVSRRIRARNLKGIAEYVRCWRGDPEERDILLQEMLVGETWFFGSLRLLRCSSNGLWRGCLGGYQVHH